MNKIREQERNQKSCDIGTTIRFWIRIIKSWNITHIELGSYMIIKHLSKLVNSL